MRKAISILLFPLLVVAALFTALLLALYDMLDGWKKAAILILCAMITMGCSAPRKMRNMETGYPGRYSLKDAAIPAGFAFVSGTCWGLHETIVHHPDRIPAGWNQNWWNGQISWRNKYAGGDPANGPRFPGSTTLFAWTTDGKHLFGTMHRTTLFAAGVTLTIGERRPAWHYIVDAGISFVAFSSGFHGIYSLAF